MTEISSRASATIPSTDHFHSESQLQLFSAKSTNLIDCAQQAISDAMQEIQSGRSPSPESLAAVIDSLHPLEHSERQDLLLKAFVSRGLNLNETSNFTIKNFATLSHLALNALKFYPENESKDLVGRLLIIGMIGTEAVTTETTTENCPTLNPHEDLILEFDVAERSE